MLVLAAVLQPIAISIFYVLDCFVFPIDRRQGERKKLLAAAGDARTTVPDAAAGGELAVVASGGGHEADERANRSDVDSSDHRSVEAPSTEQMLPPSSAGGRAVVRWRNDGCRDGRCGRHRIESHADTIALATARCVITTLPVQHEKWKGQEEK
jgi:hypothetical protein